MIKILIAASSLLLLLVTSLFIQSHEPIHIRSTVPEVIKPGDECLVQLTIDKGTISGFGRVQQVLPLGCTATAVETKDAEFFFENNVVKFIWMQLPREAT